MNHLFQRTIHENLLIKVNFQHSTDYHNIYNVYYRLHPGKCHKWIFLLFFRLSTYSMFSLLIKLIERALHQEQLFPPTLQKILEDLNIVFLIPSIIYPATTLHLCRTCWKKMCYCKRLVTALYEM